MAENKKLVDRRAFLQGGLAATMAAGVMPASLLASPQDESAAAREKILNCQPGMKYRRVGNTDMYFSVLSPGGYTVVEAVHCYAIDHGVNLVHTCRNYRGGQSIKELGRILKTRRDKVYVALKDEFTFIDDCLRDLGTDYVDFLMFNRHSRSAATDPKILDTYERYKKQGKVRFAGLTCHGDVKNTGAAAIQNGMYTVVMPALSRSNLDALDPELRTAHEKGIGVIAMKIMMGIRDLDAQIPLFKKALQNPGLTTFLKTISSFDEFDAYRKAAQEALTSQEERTLEQYLAGHGSAICMMCDACKRACPRGVEVSTILRCKEYYHDQQHDLARAFSGWEKIPPHSRSDRDCRHCRRCEAACPNGLRIVERLEAANGLFVGLA